MRILNKENWVFEWSWKPWWSVSFYLESAIGGWEFSFGIFGIGPFIRYNTKKSDAIFEKWDKEIKEEFSELKNPLRLKARVEPLSGEGNKVPKGEILNRGW